MKKRLEVRHAAQVMPAAPPPLLPAVRSATPIEEPEPEPECVRCAGLRESGEETGEALHFDVRAPPPTIEVRCCDEDVGRDFTVGTGSIQGALAGHPRAKPRRGAVETVELFDDRSRPTGSVRVAVSWTPHARPPHRLCVTVCSADHLRASPGQHLDPYCLVRVGTTTLRTRTATGGGCTPVWAPFHPKGTASRGTPRTAQGYHKLPILYDAADRGDLVEVKRALGAGVNVAAAPEGRHGNTALHRAAAAGHAAVVKELLRARADINAKTDQGWTPYHCACHSGQNGAPTAATLHAAPAPRPCLRCACACGERCAVY